MPDIIATTIQQILAPTQADNINGMGSERLFAAAVIGAVGQAVIEQNGRGITEKYTTSADVMQSSEIVVRRIKPINVKPRELGRGINGDYRNQNQFTGESENYSIKTLTLVDAPIVIPYVQQAMIPVDLATEHLKNFSINVAQIINGMTVASKVYASFLKGLDETKYNYVLLDAANPDWKNGIFDANAKLIEGDYEHGFYTFPQDDKIILVRSKYYAGLFYSGQLIVGGSNYAQEMLAKGAVSPNANPNTAIDGYVGHVAGVPCHVLSDYALGIAEDFLGVPRGTLDACGWLGYVSTGVATSRGVSAQDFFKVVDTRGYQGIEIQPLVKMGCATWFPKGNVHLLKGDAVDSTKVPLLKSFFTWLVEDLSGDLAGTDIIAGGSRAFPIVNITALSTTSITATYVAPTTLDNAAPVEMLGAVAFPTTKIANDADALAKALAVFKGGKTNVKTLTASGTATAITVASGGGAVVLAVAKDGSITLAWKNV